MIDADYGVYVKGPDGDWHFNLEYFGKYLEREGITWPLTEKGKLSTKRKTFEDMAKGHPQLEGLRQLRHARDKMRKIKLAVGADGRNRTVLWPLQGQDQSHAAESLAVDLLAGGLAALADQAGARHGGRLRRLVLDGVPDCGQSIQRSRDARILSRRSLPVLCQAGRRSSELGHQADPRAAARPLQDRPAGDPVRHPGRNPGRAARRLHLRRARDDQPASRAVRGVLALVRRLAGACARHRRDVDAARLDLPHRRSPSSTRAQFAIFPSRAAAPTFCGLPASGPPVTACACWLRCTTRC